MSEQEIAQPINVPVTVPQPEAMETAPEQAPLAPLAMGPLREGARWRPAAPGNPSHLISSHRWHLFKVYFCASSRTKDPCAMSGSTDPCEPYIKDNQEKVRAAFQSILDWPGACMRQITPRAGLVDLWLAIMAWARLPNFGCLWILYGSNPLTNERPMPGPWVAQATKTREVGCRAGKIVFCDFFKRPNRPDFFSFF